MGTSKQAAQQRFVGRGAPSSAPLDASQGFSRFTEDARAVVVGAQERAREAGNDTIAVAHLVLALVPFDAHAKEALEGAFVQAQRRGADQVGSEHVLLAVLAAEAGTGVLAGLGVTFAAVEDVLDQASTDWSWPRAQRPKAARQPAGAMSTETFIEEVLDSVKITPRTGGTSP